MSDPKKDAPQAPQTQTQLQLQERAQETAAIASAVTQKTLEAILPELIASMKPQPAPLTPAQQRYIPRTARRTCDTCGWTLHGEEAKAGHCKEHESVVVYPQNEEFADFFVYHGIRINGVKFVSNHANHAIPVPKGLKDTILYHLQEYERAEKEMRLGRTRNRVGGGGAGSVSGNGGARINPSNNWT